MSVIVHSKPSCQQCTATIRKLDKEGIAHEVVQLTEESLAAFKADGHMTAPVVVAGKHVWAGYRPDLIMAIKEITNV